MKEVLQPRGPTEEEQAVIGGEGQLRVDLSRGTVRVHDGIRQGGYELPNVAIVQQMIAAGPDTGGGGAADLAYYSTEAELQEAVPSPNSIAVVGEDGLEDIYVWKTGLGDGGTLPSAVDGNWHRLDSRTGFYVRLLRAGAINMQLGGAQPVANQDTTAWLDNGVVKLWDGAAYQLATPVLFTRLLQKIGNYESSIILPNRLANDLVTAADLNAITGTGWSKSSAADANAPSAVVSPVFTYYTDANTAYQEFFTANSTTFDSFRRVKSAGVWGSWVSLVGRLPDRLGVSGATVTDWNTAIDAGFWRGASTATNAPAAENGVATVIRYDSTNAMQVWSSLAANKVFYRRYVASVWQAWVQVYPADVTNATGTLPRVNVGISTISQAEAEAGTATTDRIFTAERVKQAIQIWWASAANYLANTANKVLTATAVWAAAVPVNLGAGLSGNLTLDLATFINAYGTATGNIVFNAVSNSKDQTGTIRITASGADRTVGFNTAAFATPDNGALRTITSGTSIEYGYYKSPVTGKIVLLELGAVA